MITKLITVFSLISVQNLSAYSTIDCTSNRNITYLFHNKVGGARPFPGMITHIEEIKKNDAVIYRIVHREECSNDNFCEIQQPELTNIVPPNFSFHFIENSKLILESDGQDMDPIKTQTYAIKLVLDKEIWMICNSFEALYP